jgi:hypothetical protein
MLERGASSTLFPCENWVFEWNAACSSVFSIGRNAHFVLKRPIHVSWRNTFISRMKKFKLEAGVCSPLFHDNWVTFRKEYCLPIMDFILWEPHFVQNRPIQLNWTNTCIPRRKTIYVRSRSIYHIVSLWELSLFLRGK